MKVIATTRTTQGTGASRRLRRADKLPGIIYGGILPGMLELRPDGLPVRCRRKRGGSWISPMTTATRLCPTSSS